MIDADSAAIMAVIADLPSYPDWAAFMDAVEVLDRFPDGLVKTARFTLDAGVIKDTYSVKYEWSDASVRWSLIEGHMLKAMEGEYSLRPTPSGCEVSYQLEVDLAIPVIGMFKRKAEKVIMDSALKGLKKRVEAGA